MTSYEISAVIRKFLAVIDSRTSLTKLLEKLSAAADRAVAVSTHTLQHGSQAAVSQNEVAKREIGQLIEESRSIELFKLASDLEALETALTTFHESVSPQKPDRLAMYKQQINEFRARYEAFAKHHSLAEAVAMFISAKALNSAISSDRGMLQLISSSLYDVPTDNSPPSRLTIKFDAPLTLGEIAERLSALGGMYSTLCRILNVDDKNEPLDILKIETGSLLIDVLGNPEVMTILLLLVGSAATYAYRNHTAEGRRRTTISERHEAINVQAAIIDALRSRDIPSERVAAIMQESAEEFASQLQTFVATGEMTVNGKHVSVEVQQLPAANDQTKLLGDGASKPSESPP